MAGLGEACTHISALLFYIDTKVRIRDSRTVTEAAAYWKLPSTTRDVTYFPVSEIDFTSAKAKKMNLDSLVCDNVILTPGKRQAKDVPLPTSDEIATSHQKLSSTGSKAAVLRVVPEHCKAFKPTVLANNFPPVLTDLFEQSHSKLPFNELLNKCDEVEITVTQEQAKCVEQATKTQSTNKHVVSLSVWASNGIEDEDTMSLEP